LPKNVHAFVGGSGTLERGERRVTQVYLLSDVERDAAKHVNYSVNVGELREGEG